MGLGNQLPEAAPGRDVLIAVLAAVAVSIVAARPAMRSGSLLLEARRVRPQGRGTRVLAGSGVVGLVLAAWPTPQNECGAGGEGWRVVAMGVALASIAAGLMALTQVALAVLGRFRRRRPSGSALVMAGRLDGDRTAISRAVGCLTIAKCVAAFGLSVFTIFTTTSQYRSAAWNRTHDQVNLTTMDFGVTRDRLAATPGISKVESLGRYEPAGMLGSAYAEALSLTCAQVRTLASVPRCSDSRPWVAVVDDADGQSKAATHGEFVLAKAKPAVVDAAFVTLAMSRSAAHGSGNPVLSPGLVMVIPLAWVGAHGGREFVPRHCKAGCA